MRTKRLSLICSMLCLVLVVFVLIGTINPCAAETKKPYSIEIYTFKVGTFTYAMGVALADLINKQSSWLRATALEATSSVVTTKIVATEKAARKKIMGFMVRWEAETGYPPFKKPYPGIRDMAVIGFVTNALITLDPNIKTVKDLAKKRVGLGTSPSLARNEMPKAAIVKTGVKGVKFLEFGFRDGGRALSDGLTDVLLVGGFLRDPDNLKFGPNPGMSQLLSTKKVYFVSFDKAAYDTARLEFPNAKTWDNYSYVVPVGGYPGQDQPWVTQGGPITWSCDKEMPEDVVYEVVSIMGKNTATFKKYHPLGQTITQENMAKLGSASKVHPGALKYYKEKGIKIGSF